MPVMNLNIFSDIPIHQNSEFIKVLIIDDDYELRRNLCKFLSESKNIQVCACLEGGIDIEKEVEMYEPDVVVTEFSANDKRGKSILEILNKITVHKPKVIVLSSSENVSALDESFGYGVNYYVKKPVILSLLKNAIISICSDKVHEHHKIEMYHIKNLLRSMSAPIHVVGFTYICEALEYLIENPKTMFLKEIYLVISEIHVVSTESVEVSIRNAIKKMVKDSLPSFVEVFGENVKSVSNSKFLFTLKEVLLSQRF